MKYIKKYKILESLFQEIGVFEMDQVSIIPYTSGMLGKILNLVRGKGWREPTNGSLSSNGKWLHLFRGGNDQIQVGMDSDDYFYVEYMADYLHGILQHYKCDGLEGLSELLDKL